MTVEALAACLRQPAAGPPPLDQVSDDTIFEHGVGPLVYRALCDGHWWDQQPEGVRERLAGIARREAVLEPLRLSETIQVIDALAAEGVEALVFKGAALAYTCYPEPWLRPRLDTDLLIRPEAVAPAARVFERMGFTQAARPAGQHVTHQTTYISPRQGIGTAFDVHWKLSDPQAFANLFPYDELERKAVRAPKLGSAARVLSTVDALLVACTHRVAHHYDSEILIFLYDIHLLALGFTPDDWERLVKTATEKRIRAVVSRGLELAQRSFGTPVPEEVRRRLAGGSQEPTALYLDPRLRKVDILLSDLRQLGGWRGRIQLLREHLIPPPGFMLHSYGRSRSVLLPSLYVHRILRGAIKWFRPLR